MKSHTEFVCYISKTRVLAISKASKLGKRENPPQRFPVILGANFFIIDSNNFF
jgi:hypothetical protein